MLSYIAIILSLINMLLLIVIIIKFKRLFSTDGIIEKTKAQMNKMVSDINNNANRDIDLIQDASRRTKALLNDADKRMEQFRQASDMLRNMIAEVETANKKSGRKTVYVQNERLSQITPVGNVNPYINPAAAYAAVAENKRQQTLFDEENAEGADEVNVREDGAAYKQVPLIITKVYEDKPVDETLKKEKNLNSKVEKLFKQGMKVEEIAKELSCSIAEVQFIIDMLI